MLIVNAKAKQIGKKTPNQHQAKRKKLNLLDYNLYKFYNKIQNSCGGGYAKKGDN